MKNNIILIGMMGCGKTFFAKLLNKSLPDYEFVDSDNEIEGETNLNIAQIFEKFGEKYFRELETKKINEIVTKEKQIISIGGGGFENPENRANLINAGITFYLKTSTDTIFERIKDDPSRPLSKTYEYIKNLAEIREQNYGSAHFTIDTNGKKPYNIIREILKDIQNYE